MGSLKTRLRYGRKAAAWKIAQLVFDQKIVVASTGRSGSTLLFNAVADAFIRHHLGKLDLAPFRSIWRTIVRGSAERLDAVSSNPKPVQKTHDLYNPRYAQHAKYIFIYGDPLDSAFSVKKMMETHGHAWFERHLYHLNSSGTCAELFTSDILNYENQLRSWQQGFPERVFIVSYEDLWDRSEALSDFVGFEVRLPDRKRRAAKSPVEHINEDLFVHLRKVKADLDRVVAIQSKSSQNRDPQRIIARDVPSRFSDRS